MAEHSFDLVHRPWIPVASGTGEVHHVGLAAAFGDAGSYRGVVHQNPLVVVSVHRLLAAVLHRVLGDIGRRDITRLWNGGAPHLPIDAIETYLERWRARFDLFHPETPFYQVPAIPGARSGPVSLLEFERASGNNATLFDHTTDETPRGLPIADAALALLAFQAFAAGGKIPNVSGSAKQAPLRGAAVPLRKGQTLGQTLVLNLVVYNRDSPVPRNGGAEDLPAWERPCPDGPVERLPSGWVDQLTWLPRRVVLVRDPANPGLVGSVVIAERDAPAGDMSLDPWLAYVRDKKTGDRPFTLNTGRAAWRDAHALFAQNSDAFRRPLTADATAHLRVDAPYAVLGAHSDKAKLVSWRAESIPLVSRLLDDPNAAELLRVALQRAEHSVRALRSALATARACEQHPTARWLSDVGREAQGEAREWASRTAALDQYWAALGTEYPGLVQRMRDDPEQAVEWWWEPLRRSADAALVAGLRELGHGPRALKASARARHVFAIEFSKLRKKQGEE